jgi:hypothetical protein
MLLNAVCRSPNGVLCNLFSSHADVKGVSESFTALKAYINLFGGAPNQAILILSKDFKIKYSGALLMLRGMYEILTYITTQIQKRSSY